MRLLNAILPLLIIAIENLLTIRLSGTFYCAIPIAGALLAIPASIAAHRLLSSASIAVSAALLLAGAWLCRPFMESSIGILILAQVVQAACLALQHRRKDGNGPRIAFAACGMIVAYAAFRSAALMPSAFLHEAVGVAVFVLAFLYADPWHARTGDIHHESAAAFGLKVATLVVVLTVSFSIAGMLSIPLNIGSDELRSAVVTRFAGPQQPQARRHYVPGPGGSIAPLMNAVTDGLDFRRSPSGKKPHVPVAHVRIQEEAVARRQKGERMYIKMCSFDTYIDGRWANRSSDKRLTIDWEDGKTDGKVAAPRKLQNPVKYSVLLPACSSELLPGIPAVAEVDLTAVTRGPGDSFFSPVPLSNLVQLAYSMTSDDIRWNDLTPDSRRPGIADPACYALQPGALADKMRTTVTNLVAAKRHPSLVVDSLVQHLQEQYEYSLKNYVASDADPIDVFLFYEKKGHCELFATSLALMLRSAGIPSRVSIGYCGGQYDPDRNIYTFFIDDAHAWTEIYVENHGWVSIDPTPASATSAPTAPKIAALDTDPGISDAPRLSAMVRRLYTGRLFDLGNPRAASRGSISASVWLYLAILLLTVAAVFSLRFIVPRLPAPGHHPAHGRAKSPSSFKLFCEYFASRGYAIRRGQTASEYLLELKRHGLVEDECDGLVAYFHAVCYGRLAPSRAEDRKHSDTVYALQDQRRGN